MDEPRAVEYANDLNTTLDRHVIDQILLANHKTATTWRQVLDSGPDIDATNYRAEQAIRPAVVNRKVWGGNRTWKGAKAQSILTSVIRTCEQRALNPFDTIRTALCSRSL